MMTIRTTKVIISNAVFLSNESAYPTSVTYKVYKNGDIVETGSTSTISGLRVNKIHEITLSFNLNDSNVSDGNIFYVEIILYDDVVIQTPISVEISSDPDSDFFTTTDSISIPTPTDIGTLSNYVVYRDNEEVITRNITNGATDVSVDLSSIDASLNPLLIVFNGEDNNFVDYRLYKITHSILRAQKDLRSYIDRLNRKVRIDSLKFSDTDYLLWMQAGKDRFNSIPLATDFTMTDATGPIRDLWLACSQYHALKVKYLEEGLESFDYSGSAVTLNVDITQYIESTASYLEQRITEEGQRLKANIHRRGLISGAGNWGLKRNVVGAAGRSLSPLALGGRIQGVYR